MGSQTCLTERKRKEAETDDVSRKRILYATMVSLEMPVAQEIWIAKADS